MDLTIINENNILPEKFLSEVEDLVDLTGKKIGHADNTEVSISFITDEKIKEINNKYRNKDRVTDVISFAIEDGEDDQILEFLNQTGVARDLGDLFIAPSFVFERAKELDHSKERELGYTVVHGILHLSGYDHIDPKDEEVMISLQEEILENYGLKK